MVEGTQEIVSLLESVWRSIDELCSSLAPSDWELDTACPGWSVKDQLSHIVGTESMLAGKPAPQHKMDPKPYVKNRIGELNEVQVDWRRPLPPQQVLEEFRSITSERLSQLRRMTPADFERQTMTPVGPDTYLEFMKIRAFDCWVHEQDIRRAVGKPGNLRSEAARHAVRRCFLAMPYVVGKKAAFPEGATAVIAVLYPDQNDSDSSSDKDSDTVAVGVIQGRGVALDVVPDDPSVLLRSDVAAYVGLCAGRIEAAQALDAGSVVLTGDQELAAQLVENLAFMI